MLLAETRLEKEGWLDRHNTPLSNYSSYQKTIRFADPELQKRLRAADAKIKQRVKENRKRSEAKQKERSEAEYQRLKMEAIRLEEERLVLAAKRKKTRIIALIVLTVGIVLITGITIFRSQLRNQAFREFMEIPRLAEIFEEGTTIEQVDRILGFERRNLSDARYNDFLIYRTDLVVGGSGRMSLYFDRNSREIDLVVISGTYIFDGTRLEGDDREVLIQYFSQKYGGIVRDENRFNWQGVESRTGLYLTLEDKGLEILISRFGGDSWQIQIRRLGTDFWF